MPRAKKTETVEPATLGKKTRIAIPTIGSRLTLAEPWAFMLHDERRNYDLLLRSGLVKPDSATGGYPWGRYGRRGETSFEFSLPAGTTLSVDRIYVRKGSGYGNFDSVTFVLRKGDHPLDKAIYGRFWAKLGDVNRIVCRWHEESLKTKTGVSLLTQLAAAASGPDGDEEEPAS